MSTSIRTILVDDNQAFLDSAARFLSQYQIIEIVGRLSSGRETLRLASNLRPDLVLMDLAMPDMDGLEATRRLKTLGAMPKVIILTLHSESAYRDAAMSAGADGFVSKTDIGTALIPLVHRLFAVGSISG
jgi:DNA-binding NarL/FixJ family response regulator